MQTITNSPVQTEVALRTLSSDLNSIEHGATAPVPESIKLATQTPGEIEIEKPAKKSRKIGRTIFMILVLIAIAGVGYFYIYPRLIQSLSPDLVIGN